MKDETCVVLDFLPTGYSDRRRAEPVAQALGSKFFSLLEIVPRDSVSMSPEEEVYIGDGKRDKVRFIRGQINYTDLTALSRALLPEIIEKLVKRNEKYFIEFFNKAGIVTPRMHQFELLPGVGKKNVMSILDERKRKPFDNFDDMRERVKLFPDPVKSLVNRILSELEGNEKYYLFTNKPFKNV